MGDNDNRICGDVVVAICNISAGALIWLLGNVQMGGMSLLARLFALLDPLGRLLGMDGVMLWARRPTRSCCPSR